MMVFKRFLLSFLWAFVLYGHPDEHGGPNAKPCVLAWTDGVTYITVAEEVLKNGKFNMFVDDQLVKVDSPIIFDTEAEASEIAMVIRGKYRSIEVSVIKNVKGEVVSYEKVEGGKVKDYPGKVTLPIP